MKSPVFTLALALLGVVLPACTTRPSEPATVARAGLPHSARPLAPVTKHSGCRVHDGLPEALCTPGAVFTGLDRPVLCRRGYTRRVRDVPSEVKRAVYRAYGIRHHYPGQYEIDHLVPLEAGGANTDGSGYPPTADPTANLWPQSTHGVSGSQHKDELENWAQAQICRHKADRIALDRQIAGNWIALYERIGAHTLAGYRH